MKFKTIMPLKSQPIKISKKYRDWYWDNGLRMFWSIGCLHPPPYMTAVLLTNNRGRIYSIPSTQKDSSLSWILILFQCKRWHEPIRASEAFNKWIFQILLKQYYSQGSIKSVYFKIFGRKGATHTSEENY